MFVDLATRQLTGVDVITLAKGHPSCHHHHRFFRHISPPPTPPRTIMLPLLLTDGHAVGGREHNTTRTRLQNTKKHGQKLLPKIYIRIAFLNLKFVLLF